MTLIAGLGNVGKEYENSRHNVGFMFIDKLLLKGDFSSVSSYKFKGELYKKGSLILLKPHTFMNLSGNSVKAVSEFYKPEKLIVVHDDLDLPFTAVRFKYGGSSGGHNGLKSIDSSVGSSYDRVRIGIGRPKNSLDNGVINYVLGDFTSKEKFKLDEILAHCISAVEELLNGSEISKISSRFTLKAESQESL